MPIGEDGVDFFCDADVVERIRVEHHQVGELARLDCSYLFFHSQKFRWINRGRLQGFERSEPCGDEALKFFMQAKAGEDIHAGWRVGAGEKWNACVMHL